MDLVWNEATTPLSRVSTHLSPLLTASVDCTACGWNLVLAEEVALHDRHCWHRLDKLHALRRACTYASARPFVHVGDCAHSVYRVANRNGCQCLLTNRRIVSSTSSAKEPASCTPSICSTCKARKSATTRDQGSMWCPLRTRERKPTVRVRSMWRDPSKRGRKDESASQDGPSCRTRFTVSRVGRIRVAKRCENDFQVSGCRAVICAGLPIFGKRCIFLCE
jgi:hypothetical protein